MMLWKDFIEEESKESYFKELNTFLKDTKDTVYPPIEDRFKAYELTEYSDVKVVILGQDPYHQKGQAMGLSFSVHPEIAIPKSLINIFKELESDLGINKFNGDLTAWAQQGVFLLNTLLSVVDSKPLSHQNKGWETFTDKTIQHLSNRKEPIIFVFWGKSAQVKKTLIKEHHIILEAPHPSPLSSYRGFFGSKPFSRINDQLIAWNKEPIDWSL